MQYKNIMSTLRSTKWPSYLKNGEWKCNHYLAHINTNIIEMRPTYIVYRQ